MEASDRSNSSSLASQCTLGKRILDFIVLHEICTPTMTVFFKAHFLTLSQNGGTATLSLHNNQLRIQESKASLLIESTNQAFTCRLPIQAIQELMLLGDLMGMHYGRF